MDIYLDLSLPPPPSPGASPTHSRSSEFAHVVAELEAPDGRSAARATTPVLLRTQSPSLWRLLVAPLRWVGALPAPAPPLTSIQLFSDYSERKETPFTSFKLTVKPREGSPEPEVLGAAVRVHLRVGAVRRLLYHLRPNTLVAILMGIGAACAALCGSIGVAGCFTALAYTLFWKMKNKEQGGDAGGGGSGSGGRTGRRMSGDSSDVLDGISTPETTPRDVSIEEVGAEDDNDGEGEGGGDRRRRRRSLLSSPESDGGEEGGQRPRVWEEVMRQAPMSIEGIGGGGEAKATATEDAKATGRTELGGSGLRARSFNNTTAT